MWREEEGADEYFDLPLRSAHKEQVVDPVLNRFNGGMGPYRQHLLDLRSVNYINATPMDHLKDEPFRYISYNVSKAKHYSPLLGDGLEMDTRLVVNLSHINDREGSSPSDKRENYWPPFRQDLNQADWPVRVETMRVDEDNEGVVEIQVRISSGSNARDVTILWYQKWVDFPNSKLIYSPSFRENARKVLHVAERVEKFCRDATDEWIVVHCSAGVGRTGTLITLLNAIHRLGSLSSVDGIDACINGTIEDMRQRRVWMVKSDSEYATIFNSF